jgi:tetratricopeptide (TPR) repeat protein
MPLFFSRRWPRRILLARKYRLLVTGFLLLISCLGADAQQYVEENLISICRGAKSDSDRLVSMEALSDYYYANKNFIKGDSVIEKQIMLAEATMNKNLVLMVYFRNAAYRLSGTSTKDLSQNTGNYINRALRYAQANGLTDYMALAWSQLAARNLAEGRLDEAFKNANLGFTTALNTENDSIKMICAVQLGNVYLQKSDMLMAFKTYINANNIAELKEEENLLPLVLHAIAAMYKKLGQEEIAKNYVFRSLAINKQRNNIEGRIIDNIFLAKMSNYMAGKDYLQEALNLADSLHNVPLKIEAQKILFFHMVMEEQPSFMLSWLETQPELKNVFLSTGPDYINWMIAEIYLYGGRSDSALIYFRKAENSFNTGYDETSKKNFFGEFAGCLQANKKIPEAILYYQKSVELSKHSSDLGSLSSYTAILRDLYQEQGDFKKAFEYGREHDGYKDSVDIISKEKDLALLEIGNETRRQQRETELAKEELDRRYNLQYMLITIVVATIFLLLLMIGMFKVSTFMIRLMGFLSLIFLFEFVILLLDKWIHELTHGEPWKNWLIKIAIISILLPMHHFLEHRLIRYLLSRHLLTVRSRLSLFKIFRKKKKPRLPVNPEGEVMN